MSRSLAGLALALCACGSAFRGGRSAPDDESFGRALQRFVPSRCEDAAHAEHEPRISLVELDESATGRVVLVERRFGHDALVVDNAFDEGAARVFELYTAAGKLRKWVIPRSGNAPALLAVGKADGLVESKGHFAAAVFTPELSCALIPMESVIVTEPGKAAVAPEPDAAGDGGAESAPPRSTNAEP